MGLRALRERERKRHALAGVEARENGGAVAARQHLLGLEVQHLVDEAEVLLADRDEAALNHHQLAAAQLGQILIVLSKNGDAQPLLPDARRRKADRMQKKPRRLVEARYIHRR